MFSSDDLFAFFESHGIAHETVRHPAVFRVGEGEEIKVGMSGAHTKNLFLKDSKGQLWLISAEQDTLINLKRLPAVIGSGRLSFGSADLMQRVLGVTPGSVTAFALVNDQRREVRFVLDVRLHEAEQVNFHPLINTATTTVGRDGLRAFFRALGVVPTVVDFTAPAPA